MISFLKNPFLLGKLFRFIPANFRFNKVKSFSPLTGGIQKEIFRLASYYSSGRLNRTSHCNEGPLKFLDDENLYLEFCEKLKLSSNDILPKQLAFVPLGTVRYDKDKYFVDNILSLWWNQLESNLKNVPGHELAVTIFNLDKINYYCNGDVLKFLNWCGIEKILECCLSDIKNKHFTPNIFKMLLKSLVNFKESSSKIFKTSSSETTLSDKMRIYLSDAFALYFSKQTIKEKYDVVNTIGGILLDSVKLDFIRNPQKELKNIIPICLEAFSSKNLRKNEDCLNNCHKIGSAFLAFDYNPGDKFFASYFEAIVKTYSRNNFKERFCVTILRCCLLVGLKFSPKEFKNISDFWKTEMDISVQHLRRPEIDEILDLCLKTCDGNVEDIANILSKNILHQLLNRTECFVTADSDNGLRLCYSTVPLRDNADRDTRMDEKTYFNICNRLSSGEVDPHSASVLNGILGAAVRFKNESEFVKNISLKWWAAFEMQLQDMKGYKLVHALEHLMKINKNVNGQLNRQFMQLNEHPAQKLAYFALKDVENKNFTDSLFVSFLSSIKQLLLTSNRYKISPTLAAEISSSFNAFFCPNLFYRRAFIYKCNTKIGEILYLGKCLSVPRPPEDIFQVIITCCAKNFNVQLSNCDGIRVREHLWNLLKSVDTFIEWNVDANKYYPFFWKFYFNEISTNYSKLHQTNIDLTLKKRLLKSILLVVLKFHKEDEFEFIKRFWQSEMKIYLNYFNIDDIQNILNTSKLSKNFEYLDNIISNQILDEFKRRVGSI